MDFSLLPMRTQAECVIFAEGNDQMYETLRVLQNVREYQDVFVKIFNIAGVFMTCDVPIVDDDTTDPTALLLR